MQERSMRPGAPPERSDGPLRARCPAPRPLAIGAAALVLLASFALQGCEQVRFEGLISPLDKTFPRRTDDHSNR